MTKTILALLAAPFLLGACVVVAQPQPEVPQGNWLLPGTSWKVAEINGEPFKASAVATLTEDGHVTGKAPCNNFNAGYTGHWPDITFQPAMRTMMACPDLPAEDQFFAAMEKVNHGEVRESDMLLTGPSTSIRLVKVK